jgi:Flp pilus assembly pilin Flp
MKRKCSNGVSIAQYAILLALIGVSLIPIMFIWGKNIHECLKSYYNVLSDINLTASTNFTSLPAGYTAPALPSDPGTPSPDNPVKSCTGDICSIDYGDIVLTGIPANLSEFTEMSGTSAGTDVVMGVIDDLIAMAELGLIETDLPALKILANKGHTLADVEKNLENLVSEKIGTNDPWDSSMTDENDYIAAIEYPAFKDALDAFLASPSAAADPRIKELVQTLGNEVKTTFTNFDSQVNALETLFASGGGEIFSDLDAEVALHPTASTITDLNSAIICSVGNYADTGSECVP